MEQEEEDREKVRYITIADLPSNLVGICYVGSLKHVTSIGKRTHSKAWVSKHISSKDARKFIQEAYKSERRTLKDYKDKYEKLNKERFMLDASNILPKGHSVGTSDSYWGISFHYDNNKKYSTAYMEKIQEKINLYEAVEKYLETYDRKGVRVEKETVEGSEAGPHDNQEEGT